MTALLGYSDLPDEIKRQLAQVVRLWEESLGDNLVGIYLHGSIALGAFYPPSGDLDLLVVVQHGLDDAVKRTLAAGLLALDHHPCPLELSVIRLADAKEWHTPGNCVFHYSDFWASRLREALQHPGTWCYVLDQEFPDADVTGYLKLIKQCGIVLVGRAIDDVFGEISDEDFWESLCADIDEYDFHAYQPRYLASNVLILGRILSFRVERRILSKYEAGLWMIDYLPPDLRFLPKRAMEIWFEGKEHDLPEAELERLRQLLLAEIKR